MEWMFLPLKRYAEFSGRSRRMEYWMYALGLAILWVIMIGVIVVIAATAAASATSSTSDGTPNTGGVIGMVMGMGVAMIFFIIILLGLFIPTLAVQVRRLHDSDRSGWWVMLYWGPYLLSILLSIAAIGALSAGGAEEASTMFGVLNLLLSLVSFVGWVVLIVFSCLPGTPGPNRYGPDPLGGTADLSRTFQ